MENILGWIEIILLATLFFGGISILGYIIEGSE